MQQYKYKGKACQNERKKNPSDLTNWLPGWSSAAVLWCIPWQLFFGWKVAWTVFLGENTFIHVYTTDHENKGRVTPPNQTLKEKEILTKIKAIERAM